MQVTSCQHRSLQGPAVGCGSPCRQPSRQKVCSLSRQCHLSAADPTWYTCMGHIPQASARGRPTNAASAQDVDQVSADSSQHSANPMEFEELSDIIKYVTYCYGAYWHRLRYGPPLHAKHIAKTCVCRVPSQQGTYT